MPNLTLEDEVGALQNHRLQVEAFMQEMQANAATARRQREEDEQGTRSVNATLENIMTRLDALQGQGGPIPPPAEDAQRAWPGETGVNDGVAERALRDMRRSLSTIPKFSGDKMGPTFRQHVDSVRTHVAVYEITNEKIAKSGLLMSLTGSAYTRASGAGMSSTIFTEAENFEEYAAALLSIFEPDSEKMLSRSDFIAYRQSATEDIGSYLAVKADLWRQAYPETRMEEDESAFANYYREVVRGIYNKVIKRVIIRENPKTMEQLKRNCLEAVSSERSSFDLGCSESPNLDGLASVTRGHQRRREDEAMEVNALRTNRDRDITCNHCGRKGHRIADCRTRMKQQPEKQPKAAEKRREVRGRDKPKETRTCRACNKVGHLEVNCWQKHGKPKKGAVNSAAAADEEEDDDQWGDWYGETEEDVNAINDRPFLGQRGRRSRE